MQRECYICTYPMEGYQCFDSRFMLEFSPECAVTIGCNHAFHYACVAEWVKKRQSCPLCCADFVKYTGYEFAPNIHYIPPRSVFASVVRAHVWKLSHEFMGAKTFTDAEFLDEIRDRILRKEKWYFHPGGSCFVMEPGALDIHTVVEYIRDTDIKFECTHGGITLFRPSA